MTSSANAHYEYSVNVDLRQALLAIAKALDFVGIDDIHHGQRVAYIAYECAKRLGWEEPKCQFAYFAGLIHDCGVSSTKQHLDLLEQLQPSDSQAHCIRGYHALSQCRVLKQFATVVRYHHSNWPELKKIDISQDDRDTAALIHIADRVDFLRAQFAVAQHEEQITLHETAIAEILQSNSEQIFEPDMVNCLCELISIDGFWFNMNIRHIEKMPLEFPENALYNQKVTLIEAAKLSQFLAQIVDAKSPFTYQHSDKVAVLAKQLSLAAGMSELTADMVYIAGLLHDVGKLRTPDGLLHKPASFTQEEFAQMKRHTVDTSEILQNFFPHSPIGLWASNHHERLDGSGYPFKKTAINLDIPSRVLAIVDIFQALTQQRPYREALSLSQVFNIMDPMIQQGKLDADLYRLLHKSSEYYFQLAQTPHSPASVVNV